MDFYRNYFKLWAIFIPISSVVVFPSIKGTTPGYLMSLVMLFLLLTVNSDIRGRYTKQLIIFFWGFILLNSVSQLILLFSKSIDISGLYLIDTNDFSLILRSSLFTQSLYLIACVSTFLFISNLYKSTWEKYIFWGPILLAAYGIYELLYFLLFHQNGDLLSNRTFGNGEISGSLFQIIQLGPFTIERLKSLTGEPSMYAFTILPFWIYAIHTNRKWIHLFLLVTLILSTSTTAILGVIVYLFLRTLFYGGLKDKYVITALIVGSIVFLLEVEIVVTFFENMVVNKLTVHDESGLIRYDIFSTNFGFYTESSFLIKLFGIGFGYARSTDMFSTILVNNGVIGFLVFSLLYILPIIKLGSSEREKGLKMILVVLFITMMVSVPEYSYLSSWLFLGISYNLMALRKDKSDEYLYKWKISNTKNNWGPEICN